MPSNTSINITDDASCLSSISGLSDSTTKRSKKFKSKLSGLLSSPPSLKSLKIKKKKRKTKNENHIVSPPEIATTSINESKKDDSITGDDDDISSSPSKTIFHKKQRPYKKKKPKDETKIKKSEAMNDNDNTKENNTDSNTLLTATPTDGVGPYTLSTIKQFHSTLSQNDLRGRVYIYVESATTGRFYRYDADKLPSLPPSFAPSEEDVSTKIENVLSYLHDQILRPSIICLRGILAGYAVQTFMEVLTPRSGVEFIHEYARLANETRRFYFVASSLCFMGTVILSYCYEFRLRRRDTVVDGKVNYNGSVRQNSLWSFLCGNIGCRERYYYRDIGAACCVILYVVALILSLIAGTLDAGVYRDFLLSQEEEKNTNYWDDVNNVHVLKVLMMCRSVCCILCWVFSCALGLHFGETQQQPWKLSGSDVDRVTVLGDDNHVAPHDRGLKVNDNRDSNGPADLEKDASIV